MRALANSVEVGEMLPVGYLGSLTLTTVYPSTTMKAVILTGCH
jgi:hypothetical protein